MPILQYGCQIWGMHSPRAALQRLNDYYLRTICRLLPSTPRKLLLTELGFLPLQVFWWRQILQFWNSLAGLPVGSLYHTVCLDNLADAFQGVLATWLAHRQHVCIQWVFRYLAYMMWCLCRCRRYCGGSTCAFAEHRFQKSALSSCNPHSRCCFMHIRAVV